MNKQEPQDNNHSPSLCDLFSQEKISRDEFKDWLTQTLDNLNATLAQQEYTFAYGFDWQHDYSRDDDYALKIRERKSETVRPDYKFDTDIQHHTRYDAITIITKTSEDIIVPPPTETVLKLVKRDNDFSFDKMELPTTHQVAQNQILLAIEEHLIDRSFRLLTTHMCIPEKERDDEASQIARSIMQKSGLTEIFEDNSPRAIPLERRLDAPR